MKNVETHPAGIDAYQVFARNSRSQSLARALLCGYVEADNPRRPLVMTFLRERHHLGRPAPPVRASIRRPQSLKLSDGQEIVRMYRELAMPQGEGPDPVECWIELRRRAHASDGE
jgi:hypothetical protein